MAGSEGGPSADDGTAEKAKFPIPKWATRPPEGSHLDVLKNNLLLQKVMIDEKVAYYMGRNPKMVDICVEHASCSRVHTLILYHGVLKRFAIVDMGSSHGTFIGKTRIRPLEVVFVEVGTQFHLGASTRQYIVREKSDIVGREEEGEEEKKLPVDEQLESLTEYNTALNRRIPQLPISLEECRRKKKTRPNVVFIEEEDIINPEDVDPSIGRFRNLVSTAVISSNPSKRPASLNSSQTAPKARKLLRPEKTLNLDSSALGGLPLNAAPDVELYEREVFSSAPVHTHSINQEESGISKKKKYVKEAWPGRKTAPL